MVNTPQAVMISSASGQAQFTSAAYNGDLRNYVDAAFRSVGGQTTLDYGNVILRQIGGINGAYASANANTQTGPVVVTVYAYELSGTSAFHFVAITPVASKGAFDTMFESFRRLGDREAAAIRPRKVKIMPVKRGDTIAGLAAGMAYGDNRVERFKVLNALNGDSDLKPGQKVKIIISG